MLFMIKNVVFLLKTERGYAISLNEKSNSVIRLTSEDLLKFIEDEYHSIDLIISFNGTRLIYELENELQSYLAFVLKDKKLIDLKIYFQLISLAYNGDTFTPDNLMDLSKELYNRKLKCTVLTEQSSVEDSISVVKCCYDYLQWKYKTINGREYLTLFTQVQAQYALYKVEEYGYRIDREQLNVVLAKTLTEMASHADKLKEYGWMPGDCSRKKFTRIMNSILTERGASIPITTNGDLSSSEKYLSEFRDHPFVDSYLHFQSLRKLHSTYLSKLVCDDIIFPHFNVLVSTGRTSSYEPNFQNFPKDIEIRKCFIPRDGYIFLIADYSTIELCTLAQTCIKLFGQSKMADVINEGLDIHQWFASVLLNREISLVTKEERSYAKACNFGFPGGLGLKQFLEYAKSTYGIQNLSLKDAKRFKAIWLAAFPEMNQYLSTEGIKFRGNISAETITGRIRSRCNYTQAKNFPFQGLAADGTKIALFKLIQDNFRVINYIHDEFVIELRDDQSLNERKAKAIFHMNIAMTKVCPDVKSKVEAVISNYWEKM